MVDTYIPLLPGTNEIVVEALDVSGHSERKTVEVVRVRPKLYGLFVGISRYKDKRIPQLSYADRDAVELYQLFNQQKTFDATRLRLLKNEEATRAKISESLAYFLSKASPHDLVVIFLAGHGMLEAGEYFFIPYDTIKDNLFGTAIKDVEFSSSMKRIGSKRVLLFTDTCHSGVILPRQRGGDSVRRFFETLSKTEGRITITASQFDEVSIEDARLKHGVFSYHLLQGLRGIADSNQDKVVGVMELYQYLSEKIPDVTRGGQHPVLLIPEGKLAGDVPLVILEK
ncbi:MAG: caspase family protein, partial [bacterium]